MGARALMHMVLILKVEAMRPMGELISNLTDQVAFPAFMIVDQPERESGFDSRGEHSK